MTPRGPSIRGSEQKSLELMNSTFLLLYIFILLIPFVAIFEIFLDPQSRRNQRLTIWDPFCGTGTTGVMAACYCTWFIGSEKYDDAYMVAVNWVHQEYEQVGLDDATDPIQATPNANLLSFTAFQKSSSASSNSSTPSPARTLSLPNSPASSPRKERLTSSQPHVSPQTWIQGPKESE